MAVAASVAGAVAGKAASGKMRLPRLPSGNVGGIDVPMVLALVGLAGTAYIAASGRWARLRAAYAPRQPGGVGPGSGETGGSTGGGGGGSGGGGGGGGGNEIDSYDPGPAPEGYASWQDYFDRGAGR